MSTPAPAPQGVPNDALLERFEGGYKHQSPTLRHKLRDAWAGLCDGGKLDGANETYRGALVSCRQSLEHLVAERRVLLDRRAPDDWVSCARGLLPSFIHMTNNRLGLHWSEEAYLAHLLDQSLRGAQPAKLLTPNDRHRL